MRCSSERLKIQHKLKWRTYDRVKILIFLKKKKKNFPSNDKKLHKFNTFTHPYLQNKYFFAFQIRIQLI